MDPPVNKPVLANFAMQWDLFIDDQPLGRLGWRHSIPATLTQGEKCGQHPRFDIQDNIFAPVFYTVQLGPMLLVSRYWMRAQVMLLTAEGQPMCLPFWWAGHVNDPDGYPQLRDTPSSVDLILPGLPIPSKTTHAQDWRYGPVTMLTYIHGKVEDGWKPL